MQHRGARHPREQVGHLPAGAALGKALKEGSTGIHERDYNCCQHLADGQRRRHGQRRDDVEPHLAAPEAAQDLHKERGQNWKDSGDLKNSGQPVEPRQKRHKSAQQPPKGEQEKGDLAHVVSALRRHRRDLPRSGVGRHIGPLRACAARTSSLWARVC